MSNLEPDGRSDLIGIDPVRERFRESISEASEVMDSLSTRNTALLVIDMQYLCATPGEGMFRDLEKHGIPAEAQDYFFYQLNRVVQPNIRHLQRLFRQRGMEVLHTRIQSMTADGRDRGIGHKRLNLHAPPGSKAAAFLPDVAPVGDEIVVNKTASGVFSTTSLAYLLDNLGVTALVTCGVYTNECVSTTIRDGCDLGYHMVLVSDACASVTPYLQKATVQVLRDRYARVRTTTQVLNELDPADAPAKD